MRLILLLMLIGMTLQSIAQKQSVEDINIVTSDIDLFWKCFDAAKPSFEAYHFQIYLDEGSKGVQDFIPYRIESAKKLAQKVKSKKAYYQLIRENSLQIEERFTPQIKQVYLKLAELYPQAEFTTSYFVIGRLNSGGTASANGLIMGAEMFGPQEKGAKLQAQINFESLPGIVAHELIHFQQNLPQSKTLLDQSIKEGAADLLGFLISEKPLEHYLDDWALPKQKELWKEFQKIMNGGKYKGWLYGGKRKKGYPNDLGYWMGYQICKAYYDKQADKKQAIYDILNIKNYADFLAQSGYGQDF